MYQILIEYYFFNDKYRSRKEHAKTEKEAHKKYDDEILSAKNSAMANNDAVMVQLIRVNPREIVECKTIRKIQSDDNNK